MGDLSQPRQRRLVAEVRQTFRSLEGFPDFFSTTICIMQIRAGNAGDEIHTIRRGARSSAIMAKSIDVDFSQSARSTDSHDECRQRRHVTRLWRRRLRSDGKRSEIRRKARPISSQLLRNCASERLLKIPVQPACALHLTKSFVPGLFASLASFASSPAAA